MAARGPVFQMSRSCGVSYTATSRSHLSRGASKSRSMTWLVHAAHHPRVPMWRVVGHASPLNVLTTFKQRALLVDEIGHAAGDRSADMDWYAKRALLAGVYSTTELYMLTDTSPGFRTRRHSWDIE